MEDVIIGEPGFLVGGEEDETTCNDIIKQFRNEKLLRDKDIVKWKIRSRGLVWQATRILLKGEDLK